MTEPSNSDLYRQIGGLVALSRIATEDRRIVFEKLEHLTKGVHQLRNDISPALLQLAKHELFINRMEVESLKAAARRKGWMVGYAAAAGAGGALATIIDWLKGGIGR